MRTLNGHRDQVLSESFSADGGFVLTSSVDGTAKICIVKSGECVRIFKDHKDSIVKDGILSASFSADGRYVLARSKNVSLWDASGLTHGYGSTPILKNASRIQAEADPLVTIPHTSRGAPQIIPTQTQAKSGGGEFSGATIASSAWKAAYFEMCDLLGEKELDWIRRPCCARIFSMTAAVRYGAIYVGGEGPRSSWDNRISQVFSGIEDAHSKESMKCKGRIILLKA
mmetsp:Transcript_18106/g.45760  ORF Transcript_18106/g.45760 Transcript_18106/m.45760 type:complete len:227 (-) Transcript_18106:321-1001(-)